jgi:GT2 family glycosyltransferase
VDYSIVIPVFNRADLTRQCLAALLPALANAGNGEVIVVDNGSEPDTAAVLADFPWVRVIRNDRNLGFAAACNQGARAASARIVIHLNNDTVAPGAWVESLLAHFADPGVGVAGAKLLFGNGTIQHAGVAIGGARFGPEGIGPFHILAQAPGDAPAANRTRDFAAVTGACLATPRALFLELGGFDECYWNGYEDVDYCFKVGARGLRVVYEPAAWLYHLESQSGVQRKRRLMHNLRELGARWGERILPDTNRLCGLTGLVLRERSVRGVVAYAAHPLPPASVLVHGPAPPDAAAFAARLRGGSVVPEAIVWAADGPAPAGCEPAADWLGAARSLTEIRAERYVVFIDTRSVLEAEWLAGLIDGVEFGDDVAAAAIGEPGPVAPYALNARATIVALRRVPQDIRIEAAASCDDALAGFTQALVARGRALRLDPRPGRVEATIAPDAARLEVLSMPLEGGATLASIVMLSWNAPEYTEIAMRSIRANTRPGTYEVIIVDNGSDDDTIARLKKLTGVRILYNRRNLGFARGCNQGIAAARGSHIVLLKNDVFVTDGWLDRLLEAQRFNPCAGVTAPRSNNVAGSQRLDSSPYSNETELAAFALRRARDWHRRNYHTDRAIGFCLCIDRRVIDEIGGIDERYGVGNFEDDDFCVRVRAAGYEILVCEDVLVHHFGSMSFKANNVDHRDRMERNWAVFAQRWDLPRAYPVNGYDATPAIERGFDRARDYVALPDEREGGATRLGVKGLTLVAIVEREADWTAIGAVANNYLRALRAGDDVVLAIAARGEPDAATIAGRLRKTLEKYGLEPAAAAGVIVEDVADLGGWLAHFGTRRVAVRAHPELRGMRELAERSPSALARLVRSEHAGS